MKLAFSTLGCPGVEVDQMLEWCAEFGVTGLELRCGTGEIADTGTTPEQRAALLSRLRGAGVRVLAVASYVKVCGADPGGESFAELTRAVVLARDLDADGVRVFPGWDAAGGGSRDHAEANAVAFLRRAAALATRHGVRIFLETHDSHPRGRDTARILSALDMAEPDHGVLAIWDVLHPWRHGELPSATIPALEPWLGYLQIKDGTLLNGGPDTSLCLPGEGDAPLADAMTGFLNAVPDGWISLEWEKAWHPELPDLPAALAATKRLISG